MGIWLIVKMLARMVWGTYYCKELSSSSSLGHIWWLLYLCLVFSKSRLPKPFLKAMLQNGKFGPKKVPWSARLSERGRGVQSLFEQCPVEPGIFFRGASHTDPHRFTKDWNCIRWDEDSDGRWRWMWQWELSVSLMTRINISNTDGFLAPTFGTWRWQLPSLQRTLWERASEQSEWHWRQLTSSWHSWQGWMDKMMIGMIMTTKMMMTAMDE